MDRRSKELSPLGACAALVFVSLAGCVSRQGLGPLDMLGMRLSYYERVKARDIRPIAETEQRGRLRQGHVTDVNWVGDVVTLADFGQDVKWKSHGLQSVGLWRDQDGTGEWGGSPLPGFWATVERDLSGFPGVFWEDTKAVYTNKSNLLLLGLAYGGSLALQEAGPDDTVEDSLHDGRQIKEGFRDAAGVLGNPAVHFGLAGLWYLTGQQKQDQKTYEVGTKLFRALAVTAASSLLGQVATWDRAPNGEWGTFPSGHTSSSFAFASVMHQEYGPLVGVPLYALSGFIGYARLEDREHDLSDVLMGGVLGLVIGHTIATGGEPIELFGGRIVPYADPPSRSSGLAWVKQFR